MRLSKRDVATITRFAKDKESAVRLTALVLSASVDVVRDERKVDDEGDDDRTEADQE